MHIITSLRTAFLGAVMIRRLLAAIAACMIAGIAHAGGGWTVYAVPAEVEIVRNQGFVIIGPFGNPGANSCSVADAIFVPINHSQYKELLSTALTAVAGGMSLKAYVGTCTDIGWHAGTFNTLSDGEALFVKR